MILIGSSSDWADPPSRQQASIVSTHAAHMQTAVHRVKSHWCVYFRASEGPGTAPAITGPTPQLHRELRGSTVIGVLRPQPRQSAQTPPPDPPTEQSPGLEDWPARALGHRANRVARGAHPGHRHGPEAPGRREGGGQRPALSPHADCPHYSESTGSKIHDTTSCSAAG